MTFRTKRPHAWRAGSGCFNGNGKFQLTTSNPRPEFEASIELLRRFFFSLIRCVLYSSENERYARVFLFDSALYFQTIIFPISPAARLKSFSVFVWCYFHFFRFPKNPLAGRHALVKSRFVFIKETSKSPRFIRLYYENDQGQDVGNISFGIVGGPKVEILKQFDCHAFQQLAEQIISWAYWPCFNLLYEKIILRLAISAQEVQDNDELSLMNKYTESVILRTKEHLLSC